MFLMQPGCPRFTLKQLLFLTIFILSITGTFGCANHSARTNELLSNNYQIMSDDELTLYYFQLEDQIELVERRKSKPSLSIGLGMGSFGSHSGTSGGVGVSTGRSSEKFATDLRDRRNKVKLELKKRDITL